MKNWVTKLLIFVIIFIGIDQFCGLMLYRQFNQVKSGSIYTTNYALRASNEDIVIFGASEVSHGLISNQIRDSLDMTCYNMGIDGESIYYQYAVLRELLKRYHPEIVIISTNILHEDKRTTIASLYPYYYHYDDIRDVVREVESTEKYKLLIKSYAFNSLMIKLLDGLITEDSGTNGYKPLLAVNKNLQPKETPYRLNITDSSLKYFIKFLESCKEAECKVYVIETPKYRSNSDDAQNQMIKKLLEQHSVTYLDHADDTTFNNHPELFKDKPHLNNDGAVIYTNLIIEQIQQDNRLSD